MPRPPTTTTPIVSASAKKTTPSIKNQSLREEYIQSLELEKQKVMAADTNAVTKKTGDAKLTGLATQKHDREMLLVEVGDEALFRKALWEAAGGPTGEMEFDSKKMATWTQQNLHHQSGASLGELWRFVEDSGLTLSLPPPQEKNNILTLSMNLNNVFTPQGPRFFAQDKYNLTHGNGRLVPFVLDKHLFSLDTHHNTASALGTLMQMLIDREAENQQDMFLLNASPIHAVTLPANARASANIPVSAAYYSFCYPCALSKAISFEEARAQDINPVDPFVAWLLVGGFVYFNHIYDIVAINALSFEEVGAGPSSFLCLGAPSDLPPLSEARLDSAGRFATVTNERLQNQGVTQFAWVIPSEMLGNHIFTQSGGFAYRQANGNNVFYPVVPPKLRTRRQLNLYAEPVHIPELVAIQTEIDDVADNAPKLELKFAGDISGLDLAESSLSALGVEKLLGISPERVQEINIQQTDAIRQEIEMNGFDEDKENLDYILNHPAQEIEVMGNDLQVKRRDVGNEGRTLQDFCKLNQALTAELRECDVVALRLYTSSTFRQINQPLRARSKTQHDSGSWKSNPHPLPATTYFIYHALKKLRAVNLAAAKFEPVTLWRGLRDKTVHSTFLARGGADFACMSTSTDLRVVAKYARSANPLIFKIAVDSPMDLGADISWLSMFPEEMEILYPPLTFLKPIRTQPINNLEGGQLITLKPSFPS
eukprot:c7660_g1_i2.p1 GENE.c7660_g1_i2~~c7660_g1_i2.p1  ORF type:complete len:826 (+),score=231.93 c7660_g1_i2:349-2478(+)